MSNEIRTSTANSAIDALTTIVVDGCETRRVMAAHAATKLLVSMVYDSVTAFEWPRAAALAFVLLALALIVTAIILAVLRPRRVQGAG